MFYSIGCAFNLSDLFYNFNCKRLKITCEECFKINKDPHRGILAKKIFRECLKVVINDIIDNNVTFHLPTGARKSDLHMKRVRGKAFKNLRRYGKWREIDLISSNFTGYEIALYLYGQRDPRIKSVYLNPEFKNRIIENINKGMNYGDSNRDKYIKDYYEAVQEKFPEVCISDIKKILNFGWKSLYLHNSYGGDTFINDKDIWCYIGYLKRNPLDHYFYYIKKLALRIRVLYKKKKIQYDGYYYFALTEKQYQEYLAQKNKRGRKKKHFTFTNIMCYQILDECKVTESGCKYIFKIPQIAVSRFKYFRQKLVTDKAELIISREPLKFEDLLVSNNKYEVIW